MRWISNTGNLRITCLGAPVHVSASLWQRTTSVAHVTASKQCIWALSCVGDIHSPPKSQLDIGLTTWSLGNMRPLLVAASMRHLTKPAVCVVGPGGDEDHEDHVPYSPMSQEAAEEEVISSRNLPQ